MNSIQIILATDLSTKSRAAVRHGCRLATDWEAKLNLLYVQDPRDIAKSVDKQIDPAREFAQLVPRDCEVELEQVVRDGEPSEEILQFAQDIDATLIVLGTRGRTGLERFIWGSVAEKVLRMAKCPVMTIHEFRETNLDQPPRRILVPIDFSEFGKSSVDFASRLALATNAELTICYVDDEDDRATIGFPYDRPEWKKSHAEIWGELKRFVPADPSVAFSHKLLVGQPGKQICDYANSTRFDYIVLGTHGRSGLSRAILGSVSEHVVRHADCPVITVKPMNQESKLPVGE